MGVAAIAMAIPPIRSHAAGLDLLSQADVTSALKAALDRGSTAAIGKLGVPDGFLANPKVRIPLPPSLQKVERALRFAGMEQEAEDLVVAMNRAAESAIPLAKPLVANAVRTMTVSDAKRIVAGGETSVTDFFREKTATPLAAKFAPIVKRETDRVGLAQRYDALASQALRFGLVQQDDASVDRYVTRRALDALYTTIGDEERAIRRDPVSAGSAIVTKVFGALR